MEKISVKAARQAAAIGHNVLVQGGKPGQPKGSSPMEGSIPGRLIEKGEQRRDAIHVAIAPVTAAEHLQPGQHVGFVAGDNERVQSLEYADCIGIVDPFLRQAVERGQRFWLFLYPNTITSLRHYWTHPAFAVTVPALHRD
jgi:hypothetical protein